MSLLPWGAYAAPIPQKNRFTAGVQIEDGPVCSNVDPTGDIFDLKECSDNTDVIANCTTGNLLRVREASGDRYILRCLNQGSTLDYSAAKYLLDDTASYADATVATQTYRGVDLRGSLVLTNASTSGGGDLCPDTVNLISNPKFTTWNTSTDADKWADTHLCTGSGGDTCESRNSTNFVSTPYALNLYNNGVVDDGSIVQSRDAGAAYLTLTYNTEYTITWWYRTTSGGNGKAANWTVWELAAPSSVAPSFSLRSTSGGVPSTWSAGESTCTTTTGAYPYELMDGDSTFHQVTETFTTRAGTGTFSAALVFCNGGTGVAGDTYIVDDVGMCVPGNVVDASAVSVRGWTEDQLNYAPTVPNANDVLQVGPFVGADASPRIAPSVVADGSVTQTEAIGLRAGLKYTAPSGSYTLDKGYSLKTTAPEVGTTKFGAYLGGPVAIDPSDDGTAAYLFKEDTCTDGQVLTYNTSTGGITCQPGGTPSCSTTTIKAAVVIAEGTLGSDSNIDATSIATDYDYIEIFLNARSTVSSTSDNLKIYLNNDTTANDYYFDQAYFGTSGHTGTGDTGDGNYNAIIAGDTATTDYFSTVHTLIMDPGGSKYKQIQTRSSARVGDTTIFTALHAVHWENSAAITRITLRPDAASTFKAGTKYQIIGYKNITVVTSCS